MYSGSFHEEEVWKSLTCLEVMSILFWRLELINICLQDSSVYLGLFDSHTQSKSMALLVLFASRRGCFERAWVMFLALV